MVVVLTDEWKFFGILQSCLHQIWVENVSNMGNTLRYTPSDCFETYPFFDLDKKNDEFNHLSESLYLYREKVMHLYEYGMTHLYNLYHKQSCKDEHIEMIRNLHIKLDNCVLKLYNWHDIDLQHNFYETQKGTRFTISDNAKKILLERLLILNNQVFEHESYLAACSKSITKKKKDDGAQGSLF